MPLFINVIDEVYGAFSAAYFYGSNGKQPGVNGYRIRDEKAS